LTWDNRILISLVTPITFFMDRKDLLLARQRVPDLENRWRSRRATLERKRELAFARLDAKESRSHAAQKRASGALYNEIVRIDRSLTFLDRALLHLDDMDQGTHYAAKYSLKV
jgi:hypothetical protein